MADRYFTRGDVEQLIPALTEAMGVVMVGHREAAELRERLETEKRRIAMSGGGVLDRASWGEASRRLAVLDRDIEAALGRITALGGVPKDLGLGLVDFPHLRHGRVVHLCWKHGEKEIRWWHGLDEGFAARKPL